MKCYRFEWALICEAKSKLDAWKQLREHIESNIDMDEAEWCEDIEAMFELREINCDD